MSRMLLPAIRSQQANSRPPQPLLLPLALLVIAPVFTSAPSPCAATSTLAKMKQTQRRRQGGGAGVIQATTDKRRVVSIYKRRTDTE